MLCQLQLASNFHGHYNDVIIGAIVSQITSLTIVYSDADQRKHQSSASLTFVRGIHRWPVNSPHKWPVTRKMFPFGDVIMETLPIYIIPTDIKNPRWERQTNGEKKKCKNNSIMPTYFSLRIHIYLRIHWYMYAYSVYIYIDVCIYIYVYRYIYIPSNIASYPHLCLYSTHAYYCIVRIVLLPFSCYGYRWYYYLISSEKHSTKRDNICINVFCLLSWFIFHS